jgi:hypothetical protein
MRGEDNTMTGSNDGLTAAARRALVANYATWRHQFRQLEGAATAGASPTGVGAPLTPAPEATQDALLAPLRELNQQYRALCEELAPVELAALETMQDEVKSQVWLRNLLDMLDQTLGGVQPARLRKYGACPEELERRLEETARALRELVAEARDAVGGAG